MKQIGPYTLVYLVPPESEQMVCEITEGTDLVAEIYEGGSIEQMRVVLHPDRDGTSRALDEGLLRELLESAVEGLWQRRRQPR